MSDFKDDIINAIFLVVGLVIYYSIIKTMVFNQQIAFYLVIAFGFWFMMWAVYLVFSNSKSHQYN